MNGELLAKCACANCGTHLEFPAEAAGQVIACPHCSASTELTMQAPPRPEGELSVGELLAGFQGEIQKPKVSPFYQLGMLLSAFVMVLLPVVYVAMIALAAYGVYWYATRCSFLLHMHNYQVRLYILQLALYAAPLFTGAILVLFMLKPLSAKSGPRAQPLSLNPAMEPKLYAFIARISELVGAPMPRRIDLVCDLNAAAGFRRGLASVFSNDLVLTLGLPLVAGLSLREFAGVVAHEMGHFTQGFGMRLSYLVRTIDFWFVRVIYQRDAWDVWLDETAEEAEGLAMMLVVNSARLGVWFSRLILKLLMYFGHGVCCFLLRQMEYHADACEIRLAGSEAFETTARRLAALNDAGGRAYKEMRTSWNLNRRLPESFPLFLLQVEAKTPPVQRERLQDTLGLTKTRLFDTHPSDGDRIREARRAQEPGIFHLDQPASCLFTRFDIVSKQVTHLHYQDDLGLMIDSANLRPVEG
jgi:Zn-dependent protease with chaperone function